MRIAAPSRRSGLAAIGVSTAASAALGWAALIVAARSLGPSGYATFSVLWGMYFALGGICAGLQQEVTRSVTASRQASVETLGGATANPLTAMVVLATLVGAVFLGASPLWGTQLLGSQWFTLASIVTVGLVCLALYTGICGVLAARREWTRMAMLLTLEPLARVCAVIIACVAFGSAPTMMAAIALPPVVVLATLPSAGIRAALTSTMDVSFARFTRNGSSLVVANGCMALLVTGYPFIVRATGHAPLGASAGVLFAGITATRAPLLLPLNGYRLAILNYFVRHRGSVARHAGMGIGLIMIVSLAGAGLAAVLGPDLMAVLFGSGFRADAGLLTVLTIAAGLMGAMSLLSVALVAVDRHTRATIGWVFAVLVSVGVLSLPIATVHRAVLGLLLGPLVGIATQALAMPRAGRDARPAY